MFNLGPITHRFKQQLNGQPACFWAVCPNVQRSRLSSDQCTTQPRQAAHAQAVNNHAKGSGVVWSFSGSSATNVIDRLVATKVILTPSAQSRAPFQSVHLSGLVRTNGRLAQYSVLAVSLWLEVLWTRPRHPAASRPNGFGNRNTLVKTGGMILSDFTD